MTAQAITDQDLKALAAGAKASSKGILGRDFPAPPTPGPAPESTFEALMYQLRSGTSVLEQPSVKDRLGRMNSEQMRKACTLLRRRKMPIGEPWDNDAIQLLITVWRTKKAPLLRDSGANLLLPGGQNTAARKGQPAEPQRSQRARPPTELAERL
jgi:hypothetical protein